MRGLVWACVMLAATACGQQSRGEDDISDAGGGVSDAGIDGLPARGAYFELRVLNAEISADGHSKVPVLAIGANDDGTPSTAQVVLSVSRLGAGTFDRPSPTLDAFGATVYFTPCNATSPSCTGQLDLTLALASDPSTALATVSVQLIQPLGVGSATPCLAGGNAMFFDGNDYIYPGIMTVTQGVFTAAGDAETASVHVVPTLTTQGLYWNLDFSTQQLGAPLAIGVYEMAVREAGAQLGHPGLEVTGDGRGCNTIAGRFEIENYTLEASTVTALTATFEQHCEGGAPVLNGCIHYEAP